MSNFPAFYEHNRERPISRRRFCKRSVARSYGYAKKLIVGKDASEPMENTCGYLKKWCSPYCPVSIVLGHQVWGHQFLVWWSSFLLNCVFQILVNTTSMYIWVLSLKMSAFLNVWKSWGRCRSWQQIKQSESSGGHSPNRWKKVVAAVFLEGTRWRHKLLNTRGPSVSLRALVTKLNSET